MAKFGKSSSEKKDTLCNPLKRVLDKVVEKYDCVILQGLRSKKEQQENVSSGRSKTMNSKHLANEDGLSEAVDVSPYPIPNDWGRVPWMLIKDPNDRKQIQKQVKELCKFYHFNGYFKGVADCMGVEIKDGCDWDGDNDFNDQTFDDLVHKELMK